MGVVADEKQRLFAADCGPDAYSGEDDRRFR